LDSGVMLREEGIRDGPEHQQSIVLLQALGRRSTDAARRVLHAVLVFGKELWSATETFSTAASRREP
jgi:hypothetical protein